jgi:hypothetical protein
VTVNIDYNVRSGALASDKIPGLTFIDRWMPKKVWLYLVSHEQKEKAQNEGVHGGCDLPRFFGPRLA